MGLLCIAADAAIQLQLGADQNTMLPPDVQRSEWATLESRGMAALHANDRAEISNVYNEMRMFLCGKAPTGKVYLQLHAAEASV